MMLSFSVSYFTWYCDNLYVAKMVIIYCFTMADNLSSYIYYHVFFDISVCLDVTQIVSICGYFINGLY